MTDQLTRTEWRRPPYVTLWLCAFTFTVVSAALIEFVVLGLIFPEWSNGQGLLLHTDSIGYHNMAVKMANRVAIEGWVAWELLPNGHFPVGFTAAHYILIAPKPWVLIPAAAATTAFSALILMRICLHFTDDWKLAALAAAPYLLFPSSAFWYSQLLKDTYFNLGILLFCLGWMILVANQTSKISWRNLSLGLILLLLGYTVMGIIRSYALTLILGSAVLLGAISIFIFFFRVRSNTWPISRALVTAGIVAIGVTSLHQGRANLIRSELSSGLFSGLFSENRVNVSTRYLQIRGTWEETPWIPEFLDKKLATISGVRKAYFISSRTGGGSVIDKEHNFKNVGEMLRYLPRAAQIAFLAPFPNFWLGEGSTRATTAMRRISMVEMLATYLALLFVPYALWRWRRYGEVWILIAFCLSILLVYSLATPNVGTLYRVRYAYLMPFMALGVLAMGSLWRELREARGGARARQLDETLNS